ncbi:MAG: amylo-alpha-1,6-glucosidase [Oscillospiraceae bacterium]|nr:amylo-alpha-1,6-glucosidase [Oscillospiraceae bacterium]MDD4413121.1 amylo-alpha-1,6-glucosidase [Oscillospiraceae bacterium]
MAGKILTPTVLSVAHGEGTVACDFGQRADALGRIACGFDKKSPEILLDFGRKVTGYLEIRTDGHSGDSFKLRYGPTSDCLHMRQRVPMPETQVYLGEYYIACRYLALSIDTDSIQANDVYANIVSVRLITSQYPVVYGGAFTSEDDVLNTVWRRGAYTLELCLQKYRESCRYRMKNFDESIGAFSANWKGPYGTYVIMDGPRRDREAWLGDIRAEALGIYTAFGAYDVCKNSLALFGDLERTDGFTVGSGSTWQNFIEYNLWGVIAVWECYFYTGDLAFLEHALPHVRNILSAVESRLDERGFISNDASWMWTIPREGYNAGTQAILYETLRCGAQIERVLHFSVQSAHWESLREKIKKNIIREFWNEKKGVFEENLRLKLSKKPVLLDVNCYAVIFGIANEEKAERILRYLKDNMWTPYGSVTMDMKIEDAELDDDLKYYPLTRLVKSAPNPKAELERFMWAHNRTVWPFINAYEVEARFCVGDVEGALELIQRCWGQPYFDETDTFWEFVHPENPVFNSGSCYYLPKDDCYNSAAHGWSGWVGYLMQSYILGVKPVKPAFSVTAITPQTGHLRHVNGVVPTPHGDISVKIEKATDVYRLTVTKPAAVEIYVNLTEAETGGSKTNVTILDNGENE